MNQAEKTNFDSVLLAGGFGKRLFPLTETIPKPMLPIFNQSAFERNLKLLRDCGFNRTAVTTMYLPEAFQKAEIDRSGVEFFVESAPLGSAGAVGKLKSRIDEAAVIISGDAVCDFDLKKARGEFLESGCIIGMVLTRTSDAGEYGSVCVEDGKIKEMFEKPSVRDTISDLVNTGIYFITPQAAAMIPENSFFDFARDLFPILLSKKIPIAAIIPKGTWFDIGSFGAYHECNMWFSKGENCVGKHTSIHPSARIDGSVIFDGCTIGNSFIRGSIIAKNVVIGNDCFIPAGCVIGEGAEIRDGASLAPSSIVNPKETVKGKHISDYFPKPKQNLELDDDCIIANASDEGYFVHLGRLLGGEGTVIAFAQGGGNTLQQACELACGAAKAGSACTVVSGGNATLASFAAGEYESRTAFIAQVGEKTVVKLFSNSGMPASREEIRAISAKEPKNAKIAGSVYLLPHGVLIKKYLAHLKRHCAIPKSMAVCNFPECKPLKEACEELGVADKGDTLFGISRYGDTAFAILPDGSEISHWQLLMICCIEGGVKEIILPSDTPDTVEKILNRHFVKTRFYNDSESAARSDAQRDYLHRDGILLALTTASICEKSGLTLSELAKRLPPFSVMTRAVFADKDRMIEIISEIRSQCHSGRNAGFDFGYGRVCVYPSAAGRFRLVAEAVDLETAEEISLKAIDLLDKQKAKNDRI